MVNYFEETQHPRAGKGSPTGGQFVSKGGGKVKVLPATATKAVGHSDRRKGVRGYLTGDNARIINNALRHEGLYALSPELQETVSALQSEIYKSKAANPMTVYRSLKRNMLPKIKKGSMFVDDGFTSTSLSRSTIEQQGNPIVEIKIGKGDSALAVQGSTMREVIIPRDTMYTIDKVDKAKGVVTAHISTEEEQFKNAIAEGDVDQEYLDEIAPEVTLYHGTRSNLLAKIKKNGLVPKASKGADEVARLTGMSVLALEEGPVDMSKHEGNTISVYMTKDKKAAQDFAEMVAHQFGGKPILLKVTVPRDDFDKHAIEDEAIVAFGGNESDFIRWEGKIKPSWIKQEPLGKKKRR